MKRTPKDEKTPHIWDSNNIVNVHTTQSCLHTQCNPDQNTNAILCRIRKHNIKICGEPQKRPQIAKPNFGERNNARDITLLNFKIYHKAVVRSTGYAGIEHGPVNRWNKIEI